MPDFKPNEQECEKHLDVYIYSDDGVKWCANCGKIIRNYEDERKIKRTHDEGA
jgi:hypothetical protein